MGRVGFPISRERLESTEIFDMQGVLGRERREAHGGEGNTFKAGDV